MLLCSLHWASVIQNLRLRLTHDVVIYLHFSVVSYVVSTHPPLSAYSLNTVVLIRIVSTDFSQKESERKKSLSHIT